VDWESIKIRKTTACDLTTTQEKNKNRVTPIYKIGDKVLITKQKGGRKGST